MVFWNISFHSFIPPKRVYRSKSAKQKIAQIHMNFKTINLFLYLKRGGDKNEENFSRCRLLYLNIKEYTSSVGI